MDRAGPAQSGLIAPAPSPDPTENTLDAAASARPRPNAASKRDAPQAQQSPPSVPAHVASRYLIDSGRYHFKDRELAFIDRGEGFSVKTENRAVLKDLIEIAQARGWQAVQVTGAEAFRREAWAQAYAAGLEVKGYTPSSLELQAAPRTRAVQETAPQAALVEAGNPERLNAEPNAAHQQSRAAAQAIRSAETTREELQLKFPELNRAVFRYLNTHERFAEAFVRAGLVRESDRQEVIALMRERLARDLEKGRALRDPDDRRISSVIERSVDQAEAIRGAARTPPPREVAPREIVRDEARGR